MRVPQVLYEFWVVTTRPTSAVGGLGRTPAAVDREINAILAGFPLFPDTPAVFPEWRALVRTHAVSGKPSHDARLVALMQAHTITHILTLNGADFARYPGITAIPPASLAPPTPPPPRRPP